MAVIESRSVNAMHCRCFICIYI